MKRIHSSASSDGFYGKLKGCRASEISTLIECNKFVFESIEDADEIESNVIFTERAISRCNELYATENGPVIVFGNNEVQGLGLPMQVKGKNSDSDSDSAPDSAAVPPTILTNVNRVRSIAAGGQHFAALTVDGDVYTWGCPDEGQLGYMPSPESESVPEKVPGLNNILQVQAGNAHTLLLNTKGQVFMCGMFLSSDDTERYHFPVDGESCHGITTTPVPLKMPENKKAIRIATGNASNFAAVLLEDGQLVTFGKSVFFPSVLYLWCVLTWLKILRCRTWRRRSTCS